MLMSSPTAPRQQASGICGLVSTVAAFPPLHHSMPGALDLCSLEDTGWLLPMLHVSRPHRRLCLLLEGVVSDLVWACLGDMSGNYALKGGDGNQQCICSGSGVFRSMLLSYSLTWTEVCHKLTIRGQQGSTSVETCHGVFCTNKLVWRVIMVIVASVDGQWYGVY